MKTGLFIDPQGREVPLIAGNETEFRVLVTRKLASGWKRGPSSPQVEPLKNETQVALGPVEKPAPAVAQVEDPPVMAVPAEQRNAAIAEAQAKAATWSETLLADGLSQGISVELGDGFPGSPAAVEQAITAAVKKAKK